MVDPTTGSSEITQDEKTMATIACVLVIFTHWVGPLIIYFIKKDQSKFVAFYAMQAMILGIVTTVLYVLTPVTFFISFGVGGILNLVFGILSAMAANKGEWYEIPVIGKFAKQQVGISV